MDQLMAEKSLQLGTAERLGPQKGHFAAFLERERFFGFEWGSREIKMGDNENGAVEAKWKERKGIKWTGNGRPMNGQWEKEGGRMANRKAKSNKEEEEGDNTIQSPKSLPILLSLFGPKSAFWVGGRMNWVGGRHKRGSGNWEKGGSSIKNGWRKGAKWRQKGIWGNWAKRPNDAACCCTPAGPIWKEGWRGMWVDKCCWRQWPNGGVALK